MSIEFFVGIAVTLALVGFGFVIGFLIGSDDRDASGYPYPEPLWRSETTTTYADPDGEPETAREP